MRELVQGKGDGVTDIQPAKDIQKRMWSLGDYRELARQFEPTAVALVEACGVGPGMEVLDVAAGTGNLAVAAARRGPGWWPRT
jgi:ubiquinone/menaquinone biosynthesis C-methylase UbiE